MKINDTEIIVIKEDITESDTEAIVNAANNQFRMGGGVAGAIKTKGGVIIEQEARRQGPVEVGDALITSAGELKAKYVIHAATMKLDFITDEEIIRKATRSTLILAQSKRITSLAFPALGCGTGGFSFEAASKIMAQEIFRYIRETKNSSLKKIVFSLFSDNAFSIFEKNIYGYLSHIDKNRGPFLTVDGIIAYDGGIVLIERKNPPFGWAIPGGFVDYGESVEEAVIREVKEETSLDFVDIKQFRVYSKPVRDPRFHTVAVVFSGCGKGILKAADDAKNAAVFTKDNLPGKMAFDHRDIVEEYLTSNK